MEQPWSLIGSYYSVGFLYLRKGDLTKAISLLEQVLGFSQAYPLFWLPWIYSSLGYAYALSKQGDQYLRWLLVAGAMSVVLHAKRRGTTNLPWLADIIARKPTKVAAVALANKMARMAWALLRHGGTYRTPATAPAA